MDGFTRLLLESEVPLVAVLFVTYQFDVYSNVTDVKLLQFPMLVTLSGMVMDVKLLQDWKA